MKQHRWRPLRRWAIALAAWLVLALPFGLALREGLSPHPLVMLAMIALALALFVGALALTAGLLTATSFALARRSLVAFEVRSNGIVFHRPARRRTPVQVHRDEIAGPFARVDEVIDAEASATTVMRGGGEDVAEMLAEGARSGGGSTDTMTWWFHARSAGSVTVRWRGFTVVLAEALTRDEAEELAHRVATRLERLPN